MIQYISLFTILSVIYVVVNILDAYLTHRILQQGGAEKNPVILVIGLWKFKICFTAALILFLAIWPQFWSILFPLDGWGIFACVWNYLQLKKEAKC